MVALKFYDVKAKKSFFSSNYITKIIKGRKFAIARSSSGIDCYRILGK